MLAAGVMLACARAAMIMLNLVSTKGQVQNQLIYNRITVFVSYKKTVGLASYIVEDEYVVCVHTVPGFCLEYEHTICLQSETHLRMQCKHVQVDLVQNLDN